MSAERRFVTADFEIRAAGDSGGRVVFGHGAVFNKRSSSLFDHRLGSFVEQVMPGAFRKTIGEADIRALFNHKPELILARKSAGTLRLAEDERGLAYDFDVPDTSYARDLVVSMERGDVTQSSFGFQTIEDDWTTTEKGNPLRSLVEVALNDISPVTYPAYPDADSGLRSALSHLAEARSISVDEAVAITRSGQLPDLIERRHVDSQLVRAAMPAGMMTCPECKGEGMVPDTTARSNPPEPVDTTLTVAEHRLALLRRRYGAA